MEIMEWQQQPAAQANTLVLYHAGCVDGFMASVVALMSSQPALFTQGVHAGGILAREPMARRFHTILVFDVPVGPDELACLQLQADCVFVFDHHESTLRMWQNELPPPEITVDLSKAGCEMAWDYFFPTSPMPEVLRHIGNRDTWRQAFLDNVDHSQELCEAIYSTYKPRGAPQRWLKLLQDDAWQYLRPKLLKLGAQLITVRNQRVRSILQNKRARWVTLGPNQRYRVCTVNSACDQSQLGFEMLKDQSIDFAVVWCYQGNSRGGGAGGGRGQFKVSLRSKRVDVCTIAMRFGGGGHRSSAGYCSDHVDLWL